MTVEDIFICRVYCCNGCFSWFLLAVSYCCTSKSSSDLRKRGKIPNPEFLRSALQKGFRRKWPGADSRLSSENPQILANPFYHSGILGIKVHKLVMLKVSSCQALPASDSRCSRCLGSPGPSHARHCQQGTSAPWWAKNEPKTCCCGLQSEMWAPVGRTQSEIQLVDRWGITLELLQVPHCGLMPLGVVEPPLEVSAALVTSIIIIIIIISPLLSWHTILSLFFTVDRSSNDSWGVPDVF